MVLALTLVVTFFLMWCLNRDRFLGVGNLRSMAFQLPELGLLALAMMVAMVGGGIDLSIVATSNLAGIVTALALQRWVGPEQSGATAYLLTVLAVGAGMVTAAAVGLANGSLIALAGASPILVTLGMMSLVQGLALVITGGSAISGLPETIMAVGNGLFCGVPIPLGIFAACAIVTSVLLERRPWGLRLYCLGANPIATQFAGVNCRQVVLLAYTLSGCLCGISGMIMISRFNSAKAGYGASYLLITILAAVLGGTAPTGGFGRVSGLVLALAILQILSSGLNLLRVSPFLTMVFWGATILLVMVISLAISFFAQRQERG
jgi:simple sugar transport system permease protein